VAVELNSHAAESCEERDRGPTRCNASGDCCAQQGESARHFLPKSGLAGPDGSGGNRPSASVGACPADGSCAPAGKAESTAAEARILVLQTLVDCFKQAAPTGGEAQRS
jgi:hypothetical protein